MRHITEEFLTEKLPNPCDVQQKLDRAVMQRPSMRNVRLNWFAPVPVWAIIKAKADFDDYAEAI